MHASRDKLDAMLKRPPEHLSARANGQKLSLFAWPTHVIEDASGTCTGFLMEEIPLGKAAKLSKYMSRFLMRAALSQDDCSLPRRVQVCRNLAAVVAELHRQKHYCVDIKPQNIYMFKDTGIVCVLDNDSFSIAPIDGGSRFPSSAFTSEYLAPELLRNGMSPEGVVNDTQDRFALAVILFQVLNFGIHPFQGVPKIQTDEWNIDLCVTRGVLRLRGDAEPCHRAGAFLGARLLGCGNPHAVRAGIHWFSEPAPIRRRVAPSLRSPAADEGVLALHSCAQRCIACALLGPTLRRVPLGGTGCCCRCGSRVDFRQQCHLRWDCPTVSGAIFGALQSSAQQQQQGVDRLGGRCGRGLAALVAHFERS